MPVEDNPVEANDVKLARRHLSGAIRRLQWAAAEAPYDNDLVGQREIEVGQAEDAFENAWAQRLRAEVEGKDEVCECGRTRRGSELHCWRVGGHLETGCGCETHSLDFEPRGLEHYFKPAEPATQGAPASQPHVRIQIEDARALADGQAIERDARVTADANVRHLLKVALSGAPAEALEAAAREALAKTTAAPSTVEGGLSKDSVEIPNQA